MKKLLPVLAVVLFITACNNGNEGSASVDVDSSRVLDSTRMVDSLRMVDTTNRMIDNGAAASPGTDSSK